MTSFVLKSSRSEHYEEGSIKDLLKPQIRSATFTLWFTWFFSHFARYSGIMMISVYYSFGVHCGYEYNEMLFTSFTQIVGVILALYAVDLTGRTLTQVVFFVLAGVFSTLPVVLSEGVVNSGMIMMIIAARACVEGAITILTVQTPELYPTEVSQLEYTSIFLR